MIHPSYVELMQVVNENCEIGEEPVVNSRYSIVCATAKRARQIVDGAETDIEITASKKPLSAAVDELYNGTLKILTDAEAEELEKATAPVETSEEETAETEEEAVEA